MLTTNLYVDMNFERTDAKAQIFTDLQEALDYGHQTGFPCTIYLGNGHYRRTSVKRSDREIDEPKGPAQFLLYPGQKLVGSIFSEISGLTFFKPGQQNAIENLTIFTEFIDFSDVSIECKAVKFMIQPFYDPAPLGAPTPSRDQISDLIRKDKKKDRSSDQWLEERKKRQKKAFFQFQRSYVSFTDCTVAGTILFYQWTIFRGDCSTIYLKNSKFHLCSDLDRKSYLNLFNLKTCVFQSQTLTATVTEPKDLKLTLFRGKSEEPILTDTILRVTGRGKFNLSLNHHLTYINGLTAVSSPREERSCWRIHKFKHLLISGFMSNMELAEYVGTFPAPGSDGVSHQVTIGNDCGPGLLGVPLGILEGEV